MNVKALVRPRFSLFLLLGLLLALMLAPAAKAAVTTDRYFYGFGDVVGISGDGMNSGEAVAVDISYPDSTSAQHHVVAADGSGCFVDTFGLAQGMPIGVYGVTATGAESGLVFTTVFDPSVAIHTGSASIFAGETYSSDLTINGDNAWEAVSGSVNWGDGTTIEPVDLSTLAISHKYLVASSTPYGVVVTVVFRKIADTSKTNSQTATVDVTVSQSQGDTTPPVLTLPANITAEATSSAGAAVTFTVSASDLVDGAITPTVTPASGSTFALGGPHTVSVSATDAAGNTATGSFTVTVVDTTPPVLTLPANKTAEATSASGAIVNFTVSASDLVDGPVTATATPASGSTFPLGTTTVSVSATDSHNNNITGSFTVTVVDTTPPDTTITSGPDGWTNDNTPTFAWSGSDLVTPTGELVFSYQVDSGGWSSYAAATSVTLSALEDGSHTFYVRAKDKADNVDPTEASRSFGVDTKAPIITFTGKTAYVLNEPGTDVVSWTASDPEPGSGLVGTTSGKLSVITLTVAASRQTGPVVVTDNAGNSTSQAFSYSVGYKLVNGTHFLQPINSNRSSSFKLGSTIPCKFQLQDYNGNPVTDAEARISVKFLDGTPDAPVLEDISTAAATSGNLFRYDPSGMQYIFNLSTKKASTGVVFADRVGDWVITATLDSGQIIQDQVSVRK